MSFAFQSLVRPQLQYAAAAWDPHIEINITKIEAVQRRAARFVKNDYRQTSSVSFILSELKWAPLADRRRLARLRIFHKAINSDENEVSLPIDQLRQHDRNTRSSDDLTFITIPARTDAYKYSFMPRTLRDWNSLPLLYRAQPVTSAFINTLKLTHV